MIRSALLSLVVATTLATAACSPGAPPTGGDLPHFEPADHRGRWVVINYWAQWCKPCIKEIPELNELAASHPEILVLGVNFDGAVGDALARQVEKLGIEFPLILADPAARLGIARPQALPTTVIIDQQGNVSATLLGPQTLESLRQATVGAVAGQSAADKKAAPKGAESTLNTSEVSQR